MATRRMFSKKITESDAFITMPATSQNLYFHLGMNCDDDGVVNNPKTICRSISCSEDDLKLLIAKRFIIPIEEEGIIVIKHHKINNYIQKDRYSPSNYQDIIKQYLLDDNGTYRLLENNKKS